MKRIRPNVAAMKARLEKNKENARSRREVIPISENPILKVEGPGTYGFRATFYPHSEDPAADPFPMRHYHFGIPGTGIVYCPQKNDGEDCGLCDFVWERMKENKGNKDKVRMWAGKLPKARVWIPGKVRDREEEGAKFFSFGTAEDKMSKNHEKLFSWFFDEDLQDWLSHEKGTSGGYDMKIEYEKYDDAKATMLNAKFGLAGIELARKSTDFGDDFDDFMKTIPNIDTTDIKVLKSYNAKTSEDAMAALEKWLERLNKEGKKFNSSAKLEEAKDVNDEVVVENKTKSSLENRLANLGIRTQ